MRQQSFKDLQRRIVSCTRCPRLVEYRQRVAREKRRAFQDWEYWGRPVPASGNFEARLMIIGLAPAAHGANRTGRMFTGDRSGDFLFETLHRFGFCNQPECSSRDDGLTLRDTYITAVVRCCPPQNRPSSQEKENCRSYLLEELEGLRSLRVVVPLGQVAWQAYFSARRQLDCFVPVPRPDFGHNVEIQLEDGVTLIASYHPSQQNTQTGLLTRAMFEAVFRRARALIGS